MKINILNKNGLLTDSDRKLPLSHTCNYFIFESNIDLSDGVNIKPIGSYKNFTYNQYSQDLCSFMTWWNNFIFHDLNGFNGFRNINFNLIGFTLK